MNFGNLDIDELRRRRGKKWSTYEPDVLPAWIADMDFPVAPAIQQRLRQVIENGDLGYPHDQHIGRLIDVFAQRCRQRHQWMPDPNRIEVIADVVQGIQICLQMFTRAGDGAVILTPIYPPFLYATREMKRRPDCCVLVPGPQGFAIDWDELKATMDAGGRVLLLCNPHNPTGRVFTRDELTRLAELAIERDLVVVSDEVHSDLVYDGREHVPFASLGPDIESRTVTLMSATKAFNIAGVRCAVMVFGSAEHHAMFRAGPRFTRGALGSVGLHATETAWAECDDWLAEVNLYLQNNRDVVAAFIAEHLPSVRFQPPQGTYLAWLDCRESTFGDHPWQRILDRGRLALSDGREFGPGGEQCVRLNFATSRKILEQVLERLHRALER